MSGDVHVRFRERLGVRFPRATRLNVYVGSERAGHRVMESLTHFITNRLKLKVNHAKSAVARPQERQFLGFSFTGGRRLKRRIAPKAVQRFKRRVRQLTRRSRGVSLKQMVEQLASYLRGVARLLRLLRDLDGTPGPRLVDTSAAPLRHLEAVEGLSPPSAGTDGSGARPGTGVDYGVPLPRALARQSVQGDARCLSQCLLQLARTSTIGHPVNAYPAEPPWYGPVCPVVWEGRHREVPPYPRSENTCTKVKDSSVFSHACRQAFATLLTGSSLRFSSSTLIFRALERSRKNRVYPGFPTLFWGLSGFFVDDLMGKALWKARGKRAAFSEVRWARSVRPRRRQLPQGPSVWRQDRRVLGLQSTRE